MRRRRDWDLFAPAAVPVSLLATRFLARRLDGGRASLGLGVFLVLFSLAVCGPWIASNYRYTEPERRAGSPAASASAEPATPDTPTSGVSTAEPATENHRAKVVPRRGRGGFG